MACRHACILQRPAIAIRVADCIKIHPTTVSPKLVNNHLTAEQKPHEVYSAEAPLAIFAICSSRLLAEDLRERNAVMTPPTSGSEFLTLACHHVPFRFRPIKPWRRSKSATRSSLDAGPSRPRYPMEAAAGTGQSLKSDMVLTAGSWRGTVSSSPDSDSHPHPKKTSRYWNLCPIRLLNSSAHGPLLLPGLLRVHRMWSW